MITYAGAVFTARTRNVRVAKDVYTCRQMFSVMHGRTTPRQRSSHCVKCLSITINMQDRPDGGDPKFKVIVPEVKK